MRDRLIFCKRYRDWTAEDWGKVIFSDDPLSDYLGHPEKGVFPIKANKKVFKPLTDVAPDNIQDSLINSPNFVMTI